MPLNIGNYIESTTSNLTISIVSHGQGVLITLLLRDLEPLMVNGAQVILTLNIPEDESFLDSFKSKLLIIRNNKPKGFGENHNQAFSRSNRKWFAVLNPDIRCKATVFNQLIAILDVNKAAVVAPSVVNPSGAYEDSARYYPTLFKIGSRVFSRIMGFGIKADYNTYDSNDFCVDWVAGMFMIFNSNKYYNIKGFDQNYFMYLEDADICRRLNKAGQRVMLAPKIVVVHAARRASRKNIKHLAWHLKSMFRFIFIAS